MSIPVDHAETLSSGSASSTTLARVAERVAKSLALLERAADALEGSEAVLAQLGVAAGDTEELIRRSMGFRAELRASVALFVSRMKVASAPPQEVLVCVKGAVGAAARAHLPPRRADELLAQATQWAIEAYYPAA